MPPVLRLIRMHQWSKSAFVFAPLFFSLRFTEPQAWLITLTAAVIFALLSSSVYILNDIVDLVHDRQHPVKRLRPLAAGEISVRTAAVLTLTLAFSALALCVALLPAHCLYICLAYLAVSYAYLFRIKRVAILDVMCIATGFVLRVLMGGYALSVWISPWIIVTSFMLALFLGFGKRLHEFNLEDECRRPAMQYYNRELLTILIANTSIGALICYTVYAADMAQQTGKIALTYTVVFVVFGLFRYLQLLLIHHKGGEPEELLWKDKSFVITIVLWLFTTLFILAH